MRRRLSVRIREIEAWQAETDMEDEGCARPLRASVPGKVIIQLLDK